MTQLFTDTSANLPVEIIDEYGIEVVPFSYTIDGVEYIPEREFDGKAFYAAMRAGSEVKTSMVNAGTFIERFKTALDAGKDVLYIGMSGGISGTANAALMAKQELDEEYPDRKIVVIDTLAASLGEGLFVIKAAEQLKDGVALDAIEETIRAQVPSMCQSFTVDDLNYLKEGGRVSNSAALVGSILDIKPVLYVPNAGTLDVAQKVRGRKAALRAIRDGILHDFSECDPTGTEIHILQADCVSDAEWVRDEIRKAYPQVGEITITALGVVIGAHCGPGLLTVFYLCNGRRP